MSREERVQRILKSLGVEAENSGGCSGPGAWLACGGEWLESEDPTTAAVLARVKQATEEDCDRLVETAREAFLTWRHVPAPRRGLLIRDLGDALREIREPLGELVALEMGKIRAEGIGEVQEMIDICDFAVGLSRQLYGKTMPSERPAHRMMEQWHPLGPIGIITAFNFPAAVWSWNAAIAAICGDTMIWKPSEITPLVAVAIQNAANRVCAAHGVSGLFNLVIGPPERIGNRLLDDGRLPLISFTGSIPVGRHVAGRVGQRLGKALLELGGNNAVIVTDEADLELAVRAILFGSVGTAGQRCTTTRRVIVQKGIADGLSSRLAGAFQQVRVGDPLDESTLMGPLIHSRAVEAMSRALEQAKEEGGEILTGGSLRPDLGPNFVEPAIVRMPKQTELVRQETFAPILYLLEFETLDEALALHNSVTQGLSSAIFTGDLREAEYFLSPMGSDCGIANVNLGTSGAEIGGAFGGEKETGGGRESGSDAWKIYMRRQTNTVNWSTDLPLAQGITFGEE